MNSSPSLSLKTERLAQKCDIQRLCQTRRWTNSTNVCHRRVVPYKERWTNNTNVCHRTVVPYKEMWTNSTNVCHRTVVPYKERWTNSTKSRLEPAAYWDSNRVIPIHILSALLLHHPQTVTEIIRHLYSPTTCVKGGENLRTGRLKLRYAHRVLVHSFSPLRMAPPQRAAQPLYGYQ
jgi:hypothetical protein